MKIEKMYIQNRQAGMKQKNIERICTPLTEEGGEKTLPLPWTVREWLQADARLLIKAAKAIAEMNEM